MSVQATKARLAERFGVLEALTASTVTGDIRGLIVSGAPGVGKSAGVDRVLTGDGNDYDEENEIYNFRPRFQFVKGHSTAAGFYRKLYEFRSPGEVLVLDDCDSIFQDETSLNLLKAALDTSRTRTISWAVASTLDDVPKRFQYEGSLIFITNLNFDSIIEEGRSKLIPHLEALMDRCLYLSMTIDTIEDKLIRIEQVAIDLGMLEREGLTRGQAIDIMQFIRENAKRFRTLSLRQAIHLATLYKRGPNWKTVAEMTLM